MNERIKELAEQANLRVIIDDGDFDLRKFADKLGELIILECDKFVTTNFNDYGMTLGYKIKKHFGVNDES